MTTAQQPISHGDGLRALANMLDANPDIAELISYSLRNIEDYLDTREEVADVVRAALRAGAKVEKEQNDRYFYAHMHFGPVRLTMTIPRNEVCEAVVVGTREVTEEVPDPDALAAVPKIKVTKVVEDIEWRCGSLLADGENTELAGASV